MRVGQGRRLASLGELADAGWWASPTTAPASARATLIRNALAYAGALGLPIVDHAEDVTQTAGAEANDGFVATVLGLRGWPAAAEETAVARDLAILAEVVADMPAARLHLTHLSTAGALELVRRAKAAGLPVTCDVTPHHLALTDEWLAGARRWAWDATGDPWGDGRARSSPRRTRPRSGSIRRCASAADAAACREALLDGTADAIATDHAPHAASTRTSSSGWRRNGISGIETALGVGARRRRRRAAAARPGAELC